MKKYVSFIDKARTDSSNLKWKASDLIARSVTMDYKKHGRMTIQCFFPRLSKGEIDDLDVVLGRIYGLTAEQLEFVINHDIKYRMGQATEDDND